VLIFGNHFWQYFRKWSGTTDHLKPHCIQSSRVIVPAGTSKSTPRCHGIQAVTRVMAYVADAVTLWRRLQTVFKQSSTGGFELASSALTSSTLKWLHWIQCGFKQVSGSQCLQHKQPSYLINKNKTSSDFAKIHWITSSS
jgi:hypothetical protein